VSVVGVLDVDVLVIGGGAAGVAAARSAHEAGATACVVSESTGATAMTSGVVWGPARDPFTKWAAPAEFHVGGRYVTVGAWIVTGAQGAIGSLLDLATMSERDVIGVVDLATHPSWSARLVAETLGARVLRADDAPSGETFREVALALDTDGIAEGLAARLAPACQGLAGVLFPPVLGVKRGDVHTRMAKVLGVPVGEAAGAPGDPPGVRLARAIRSWLPETLKVLRARATVTLGASPDVSLSDGTRVRAKSVVLATGGLTGAGVVFDIALHEATAGAPLWTRNHQRIARRTGASRGADPAHWFDDHTGLAAGAGVRVDARARVVDFDGEEPLAPWLFACGEVCVTREVDGVATALSQGALAGREAARYARGE
jgi:anaerobic glycerol-3-phosphate dehydrogenase